MLKVVENESSVRRYQRQFARALKAAADETIPVKLGHPGASEKAKVAWSERLGIWFFSRKIAGSRHWNAFGVGRPEGGAVIAITCEINFPLCGIDRRTGGAFAEDREGRICVVHRGKLGGGRKGIGKSLFKNRYRGVWEVIDDGSEETPVAVIGVLQSPRFARQVAQFVRKIALVKEAAVARSSQAELTFDDLFVREDLLGARYGGPVREPGAECDHGLIVRDLAEDLKKSGLQTGNDGRLDLMAVDHGGRVRAFFQVLTETTLPGLHEGAAQLLLNAPDTPGSPLLILALPTPPETPLREKLKRLNIHLLIYQWAGERAIFAGLSAFFPRIAY
ncbi:MAG: hypothetical protein KJ936_05180 [Proteobacteria bacterium]|nr:hypothetical protein [Pseudomonadota bacterium]MBU2227047.1 hypothetical protein [Pseudomonadota bacterium]MBU2261210.1 hypothetical protein [Pseudomonadota bacterium]